MSGVLAVLVPLTPAAVCAALGLLQLAGVRPSERTVARASLGALAVSLCAALALSVAFLGARDPAHVSLGRFFGIGGYGFELSLHVDGLALVMMLVVTSLYLAMTRFSVTYLHREEGFGRYFTLVLMTCAAALFVVESGSYDQLFIGWELLGLGSVLLIAFFPARREPRAASLRALVSYRICDLGLLLATALLHAELGSASSAVAGAVRGGSATAVGLGLLFAAMGKSAQLPVGGWLPRAMEGPTPSSALFYGAVSVHVGAYLLLRAAPILAHAPAAAAATVVVGAATAIGASFCARAQSDAKTTLGWATMAQIGLVFVEIGLGLRTLAIVHLVGNACLRGFQLLRAPSVLADHAERAAALGRQGARPRAPVSAIGLRLWRLAHDGLHLDALVDRFIVAPLLRAAAAAARFDRALVRLFAGERSEARAGGAPRTADVEPLGVERQQEVSGGGDR